MTSSVAERWVVNASPIILWGKAGSVRNSLDFIAGETERALGSLIRAHHRKTKTVSMGSNSQLSDTLDHRLSAEMSVSPLTPNTVLP
jgi:hypothetical protein